MILRGMYIIPLRHELSLTNFVTFRSSSPYGDLARARAQAQCILSRYRTVRLPIRDVAHRTAAS